MLKTTPRLKVTDDLNVSIGDATVRLTPARGLRFSETLARKAFRQALAEEAAVSVKPEKRRAS